MSLDTENGIANDEEKYCKHLVNAIWTFSAWVIIDIIDLISSKFSVCSISYSLLFFHTLSLIIFHSWGRNVLDWSIYVRFIFIFLKYISIVVSIVLKKNYYHLIFVNFKYFMSVVLLLRTAFRPKNKFFDAFNDCSEITSTLNWIWNNREKYGALYNRAIFTKAK